MLLLCGMLFGAKVCDGRGFVNAGRDEPPRGDAAMVSLLFEDFGGFFGEQVIGGDFDISSEVREYS